MDVVWVIPALQKPLGPFLIHVGLLGHHVSGRDHLRGSEHVRSFVGTHRLAIQMIVVKMSKTKQEERMGEC